MDGSKTPEAGKASPVDERISNFMARPAIEELLSDIGEVEISL
jgi:hypothetical protein